MKSHDLSLIFHSINRTIRQRSVDHLLASSIGFDWHFDFISGCGPLIAGAINANFVPNVRFAAGTWSRIMF